MRKLMLLCVAMVYCTCSFAQMWDNSKPDKNVTFGVRAGLNYSTYSSTNHYYNPLRGIGGQAGLNVDFNIVKSFAIETGLFYTLTSALKQKYTGEKILLSGCEIPILAKVKFPIANEHYLQLKSGISASYLVEKPETLAVHKPDIGLIVGLGISLKKIYIGTQYEMGINSVATDIKKNYLALMLGYDF